MNEIIKSLVGALKRQDKKNKEVEEVLKLLADEIVKSTERIKELEKFKKQFD